MDSDTLRLIDANANRAREGLRTAEDYLRFCLGPSRWTSTLKDMRAKVTTSLHAIYAPRALLASRQAVADPLRPTEERPEREAASGASEDGRAVAIRGVKRAQEALRVLEEFTRAAHAESSQAFSRMRYLAYDCEQYLGCAASAMQVLSTSSVYVLLSEELCSKGLLPTAQAVIRGGAKVLQLREKTQADAAYFNAALDLRKLCDDSGAVLICNDRIAVALVIGACGVHVGQHDLPAESVRKVCGHRLIVGRSTHSVAQARVAVEKEQADYIGIGSMFETSTKQQPILAGLKLAEEVAALKLNVPVFAIGGIKLRHIDELKRAGVRRIAVSSAVISATDPEHETRRLMEALAN